MRHSTSMSQDEFHKEFRFYPELIGNEITSPREANTHPFRTHSHPGVFMMLTLSSLTALEVVWQQSWQHNNSFFSANLTLQWRHYGCVSNHQPHDCLLKRLHSGADQRNQSSASLAFVREIHRSPVNSPHKWPVTRKMFPFDDVIMKHGE